VEKLLVRNITTNIQDIKMKVFLCILLLFTPVMAFKLKSNICFNLIDIYSHLVDEKLFQVAVYKLSIKDNTRFLRFVDENFEIYLLDFFSNETDEHVHRNLTFRKKNDSHTKEYSAKNLITDDRSRTLYKFNFNRFLYKFVNFCKSRKKCEGKIEFLQEEQKAITKYLQIDAHLTLCNEEKYDHLETCVEEYKENENDENKYILFVVLVMLSMMAFSTTFVQIYECYQKLCERRI